MTTRGKVRLAQTLLLFGGLLCLGWVVVLLLSLFDLAEKDALPLRALNAFGPLGVVLVILGVILAIGTSRPPPPGRRGAVAEPEE